MADGLISSDQSTASEDKVSGHCEARTGLRPK